MSSDTVSSQRDSRLSRRRRVGSAAARSGESSESMEVIPVNIVDWEYNNIFICLQQADTRI